MNCTGRRRFALPQVNMEVLGGLKIEECSLKTCPFKASVLTWRSVAMSS